jgi:hypothetical protein
MTTQAEWDRFFKKLSERGNITDACAESGVGRTTVYEHIAAATKVTEPTPEALAWHARFEEAKEVAMDRLESEAFRRAHDGWIKKSYTIPGREGSEEKHVEEMAYSDTLMVLLLKAHRPEKYKERTSSEVSGPGGKPIQTETKVIALPAIDETAEE